jgi:O-methyltransferase
MLGVFRGFVPSRPHRIHAVVSLAPGRPDFGPTTRIMGILGSRFLQNLGGGPLERLGINALSRLQLAILGMHKDPDDVRLIRRVRRERQSLVTAFESFLIHALARAHRDVPGAMAEVGVFRGGSAKLICEAKGTTPLHLFDTFAGLPAASACDEPAYVPGQYACSLESVAAYLAGYPAVHFHPGHFPATATTVADLRFSFVHCDVDLYESTTSCLEFFYPRMLSGGVLLSHDYSVLAGVRQAFGEFFANRPEGVIELPTTQCLVIKQ